jgi:type I restriction-modification system DNA methylase subunit
MSEIQLPRNRKEALEVASRNQPQKISVNDPACGSGSLLCAAWEVAHKRGYADLLFLSGQDIDPYCVAMTRINIIMRQELALLRPYLLATY